MKNIRESVRRTLKEMEDDNSKEITIYKMLKRYTDEFGIERTAKLVQAIVKQLSSTYVPSRVSDDTVAPDSVMEEDDEFRIFSNPGNDSVESIGDDLISSSRMDSILTNTYATDFSDEFEYADNLISELVNEYIDSPIYDELYNYIKDTYGDTFLELYNSGEDDYFDGDNDEEFFD